MIVGRSPELAVLAALATDPARAEAVLLVGGPASGKTALLEAASAAALAANRRTWIGSFDATSVLNPTAFLTRALEGGGYAIGDLATSIEAAGAAGRLGALDVPADVVVDVLDVLEDAGTDDGSVLILDDLHHAPPSSIALLVSISKRLKDLRVTLLMAARTEALAAAVAPLAAELTSHGHAVLDLEPLTDAAVAALSSLALRRLVDVPLPTTELLRTAAVLGMHFRIEELASVAELTTSRIASLLQPAVDRGVLRAAGEDLRFGHESIRLALYEALAPGVRAAMHRDIADRLHSIGADPATVALHLLLGAQRATPGVHERLVALSGEYAPTAPAVAADLLERARSLTTDPEVRDQLGADLAPLLLIVGRQSAAEDVCREVLAASHDDRYAALLLPTLARALFARGAPVEGVQILRSAIDQDAVAPAERVRLLGEGAFHAISSGLLPDGITLAEEALRLDVDSPDDVGAVAALCAQSVACGFAGQFAAGLAVTELAMTRARRSSGWQTEQYLPGWFHANALMNLDRLDEARAAIRRTSEYVRHWSMRFGGPAVAMADSWIDWYQGRLADSAARAEAGLDEADESGVTIASCQHNCVLTIVTLELNDVAAARVHLDRAAAFAADGSTMFGVDWLPWLHAVVLEAEGDVATAAAIASAGWRQLRDLGDVWPLRLMAPDAVRVCLAAGLSEEAAEIGADMAGIAETMGSASADAAALRAGATLGGDSAVAERAVAAAHRSGRVLEEAHACVEAADLALASGRRDLAVAMSDRAVTLARASSARRLELRATQTLRAAGRRSGARGSRARPETGWASLSPTELKVAGLVAEGLRNQTIADRLFISRRTVETHLKHIFVKLGVTSRTQVAAFVVRNRD